MTEAAAQVQIVALKVQNPGGNETENVAIKIDDIAEARVGIVLQTVAAIDRHIKIIVTNIGRKRAVIEEYPVNGVRICFKIKSIQIVKPNECCVFGMMNKRFFVNYETLH